MYLFTQNSGTPGGTDEEDSRASCCLSVMGVSSDMVLWSKRELDLNEIEGGYKEKGGEETREKEV